MEIRIYNPAMNFVGIIENQTSLQWCRKYNDAGNYELHAPITSDNMALLRIGNLVWKKGSVETGVIEDIRYYDNSTRREIVAKGRFAQAYLDRRLVRPTINFSGKVEVAMRQLYSGGVPLPNVVLGELNGYTEEVSFQATYRNMLDYESKLAKSAGFGFRFTPNFTQKTLTFDIYKGTDRSRGQKTNQFVEFSDKFDNLRSFEYHENSQLYKNIAYVGGQGEGEERIFVTVGDDSSTGLDRRELFVDARDLQAGTLTQEQYEEKLRQRGQEGLKSNAYSIVYEGVADPNGNFRYKTDYDVGDIVTVRKSNWGLSSDLRISEVTEVYEHEISTVSLTFGDPLPETIDWSEANGR